MKRIGLVFLVLVGCAKHDAEVDSLVADAHDVVLPKVRKAIASGNLEDAPPCSRVTANVDMIERDGGHDDVVKEIKDVCMHDIHVAYMQRAVAEAEVARKKRPAEKVMVECFSADYDMAVQRLNEARMFDKPAEALQARWMAVCPVI